MLNQNSLLLGIALGLIIPFVGYALLLELLEYLGALGVINADGTPISMKPRTIALLALCLNLIPFQIYNSKRYVNVMRGISLPTIIYGIAWFVFFGEELLRNI